MNDDLARELIKSVNKLAGALGGQLQTTTLDALASDTTVPFSDGSTITGTTPFDVWDPGASRRFIVRGGIVTVIVSTQLAATDEVTFNFIDSTSGKVICPIGSAAGTAAVGTIITGANGPFRFRLGDGVRGSALAAKVRLAASADIVGGHVVVSGILWGTEVPG